MGTVRVVLVAEAHMSQSVL